MKLIQTLADVHALKAQKHLPSFYVEEIESQFLVWYEAENEGEPIDTFSLPSHACIYHLEQEEDEYVIMDDILAIEFVELERVGGDTYYRIGKMLEHEMSIIYFLEGTLSPKIELWLAN